MKAYRVIVDQYIDDPSVYRMQSPLHMGRLFFEDETSDKGKSLEGVECYGKGTMLTYVNLWGGGGGGGHSYRIVKVNDTKPQKTHLCAERIINILITRNML